LLEFITDEKDREKIKKEIDDQKPLLKNVKQWRNEILAHQNKHVAVNIQYFYKKYPIQGNQIEKLLSSASIILGMVKSTTLNYSRFYSFTPSKDGSKRPLDGIISKLSKDV